MLAAEEGPRDNDVRGRLVAAASEEFARHGFAGARVRRIADAAQVNLAAVNYYFGGKEGLYRETLRLLAAQSTAGLESGSRGRTPEERLQRRVLAMLDRFIGTDSPSALGRILAHEAMNPTGHFDSLLADTMRPDIERIQAKLRQIAGPTMPEIELTHSALGIVGQCLLYLYARPTLERIFPGLTHGPDASRRLARQITEFSLGGLERLKQSRVESK
jgi:AcrR family transcriptional regulator